MAIEQEFKKAQVHLAKNDKVLAPVVKSYGTLSLTPHSDHYGELVSSIVGQQLSAKAGATIWRRVLDLFGGKMPTPEQLIKVDPEKIRAAGVSYPKIGYMKDLATHIIDGRLDMAHIAALSNDELIEQLTAVKGIGEWSAHMFMIFGLARLDILPVGDLGIRKAAMNLYGLGELPDPVTLRKLSAKNHWSPYESVAALYLWKSLDSPAEAHRHEVLA
jgi:DNA-3-methyladenine glycosylase II